MVSCKHAWKTIIGLLRFAPLAWWYICRDSNPVHPHEADILQGPRSGVTSGLTGLAGEISTSVGS